MLPDHFSFFVKTKGRTQKDDMIADWKSDFFRFVNIVFEFLNICLDVLLRFFTEFLIIYGYYVTKFLKFFYKNDTSFTKYW